MAQKNPISVVQNPEASAYCADVAVLDPVRRLRHDAMGAYSSLVLCLSALELPMPIDEQLCFIDFACQACDGLEQLMDAMVKMPESLWQDPAGQSGQLSDESPTTDDAASAQAPRGAAGLSNRGSNDR